jgi:hypothetical protein
MATRRKFNFEALRDLHSKIGKLIAEADATAQPIEARDSGNGTNGYDDMSPRGASSGPRGMDAAVPGIGRLAKNR